MRRESIRELKQDPAVRAALSASRGRRVRLVTGGSPEGVAEAPAESDAAIALWAAPTERSGDYRLAIRVQDEALVDSPEVRQIAEAARGEVDVSYIGVGFKERVDAGTTRIRPLEIGCSIGHPRIQAGTLGCFVEGPQAVCVLSNNHVLADEDSAAIGDPIVQPGKYDGGRDPDDVVAHLAGAVPLVVGHGNTMDAAIAKLADGIDFEPGVLAGLGNLTGVAPSLNGREPLAKLGRTTRVTRGRIVTLDLDRVKFNYDKGPVYFDDIIEVAGVDGRFTNAGDSGSLVVIDEAAPHAVALHIGGLPNGNSAAAPLPAILQRLGVALVT